MTCDMVVGGTGLLEHSGSLTKHHMNLEKIYFRVGGHHGHVIRIPGENGNGYIMVCSVSVCTSTTIVRVSVGSSDVIHGGTLRHCWS